MFKTYYYEADDEAIDKAIEDYQSWKNEYPLSVIVQVNHGDNCVVHVFHDIFDALYTINAFEEKEGYEVFVYEGKVAAPGEFDIASIRYKNVDAFHYTNGIIVLDRFSFNELPGYLKYNLDKKIFNRKTAFLLHEPNDGKVIYNKDVFKEQMQDD